jgi:hypothetical protein
MFLEYDNRNTLGEKKFGVTVLDLILHICLYENSRKRP